MVLFLQKNSKISRGVQVQASPQEAHWNSLGSKMLNKFKFWLNHFIFKSNSFYLRNKRDCSYCFVLILVEFVANFDLI